MTKPVKIPAGLQRWIDARKRHKLSHCQIQMARELNMNPKKFDSMSKLKGSPWKMPLPKFIETSYRKRFRKEEPDSVLSIEDKVANHKKRKLAKKKLKEEQERMRQEMESSS